MVSSDYFYDWGAAEYTLNKKIIDRIKSLKSRVVESGYYDDMVQWPFSGSDEELQDIWITMQFLSMTATPKQELIDKYDLVNKKYLINLMRGLYLDPDNDEDNCVTMGYKRPFGNSHVADDVRDELVACGIRTNRVFEEDEEEEYDDDKANDYSLEYDVLKEFSRFITDFFADGFEVRWYGFEKPKRDHTSYASVQDYWKDFNMDKTHSYLRDWKPSKSEIRNQVINKVLNV